MPPSNSQSSDIPVGTQFSPALIDLHEFLKAAIAHSGDKDALQQATWVPPVHLTKDGVPSSTRTANLPLEAAVQYGLLTKTTYEVTDLTRELALLSGQDLYDAFARHIMLNLGGLRVVEAAQQMRVDNLSITGDSLARYCTSQGFHVVEHNTAINSLRMWLEKAGVFSKGWDVDEEQKERIAGLSDDAIGLLVNFTAEQRAFVRALCRIAPKDWYKAADVRDLAEATANVRLGRSSLPKDVLEPLQQAGLIEYQTGGTQGGKSSVLRVTDKFDADVLDPFVTQTTKTLDPGIIAYYRMLPENIYEDLRSDSTFTKGKALEAYAIYIMRLLGLHFLGWRKRAQQTTGNAEVDVLLSGLMGPTATRWQVQCKNTPSSRVDLEDVAKEVGLLPITHATHIMVIANCSFTADARGYASEVMRHTPVAIHLLDKQDYAAVEASPGAIGRIIRNQARDFARQQPHDSLWKAT